MSRSILVSLSLLSLLALWVSAVSGAGMPMMRSALAAGLAPSNVNSTDFHFIKCSLPVDSTGRIVVNSVYTPNGFTVWQGANFTVFPNMTVDWCARLALQSNFLLFGLSSGGACVVGTELPSILAYDTSVATCNTPCTGNNLQLCGGAAGAISYYSWVDYQGCYADVPDGTTHFFPFYWTSFNGLQFTHRNGQQDVVMTIELCAQAAMTFKMPYFGLQNMGVAICYLGVSSPVLTTAFFPRDDTQCLAGCWTGRKNCGGIPFNAIYSIPHLLVLPSPITKLPTPYYYTLLDCITGANQNGFVPPLSLVYTTVGNTFIPYDGTNSQSYPKMTIELCAYLASLAGYFVFGLTGGQGCLANPTILPPPSFTGPPFEGWCNAPCGGNPMELCGGSLPDHSVSYYELFYQPPQPAEYQMLLASIPTTTVAPAPLPTTVPFFKGGYAGGYFIGSISSPPLFPDFIVYDCAYISNDFLTLVYIQVALDELLFTGPSYGSVTLYNLVADPTMPANYRANIRTTSKLQAVQGQIIATPQLNLAFFTPLGDFNERFVLGADVNIPLISALPQNCGTEINHFLTTADNLGPMPIPASALIFPTPATTAATTTIAPTTTRAPANLGTSMNAPALSNNDVTGLQNQLATNNGLIAGGIAAVGLLGSGLAGFAVYNIVKARTAASRV